VDSNRLFIAPVWHATAKTSFSVRYDYTERKWKDVPVGSFDLGRTDKIEAFQAGVDWQALRTITVSGYVREEKLRSSINAGYRATVYGLKAIAWF
jgi:hypothetical protein